METTIHHEFWWFVGALVPFYIIVTLAGLYLLKLWSDRNTSLIFAMFISGAFAGIIVSPTASKLNVMAMTDLGWRYWLLSATNLVLWAGGVALVIFLRSLITKISWTIKYKSGV